MDDKRKPQSYKEKNIQDGKNISAVKQIQIKGYMKWLKEKQGKR